MNSSSASVTKWLNDFGRALENADIAAVTDCFQGDCYWRDLLTFTWNIKTMEGKTQISEMLNSVLVGVQPGHWLLQGDVSENGDIVEAFFTFDTAIARGIGHLRLRDGRCWTLLTTMTELKGYEERKGACRELGVEHRARRDRVTWLEQKQQEQAELGFEKQPYCLIVGGGQGGIALGARLRRLGVPTIIVEKNARAGDSWRNRYRSLVLHDPVWYDHLPYLPFPDDWPVFTPKDKMGDWLESYTKIMELNYWSSTECIAAEYDNERQEWKVHVDRDGQEIELRPKHLVLATGAYGFARVPHFAGIERFNGEAFHTSTYQSGESYRGKRCVVIGTGSSAHDICVELWENGAEVTMIQRSSSIIIRSETLMELGFTPLYSEQALANGITTDKADLLFASMPFRLMALFQQPLYQEIARHDAEFYQKLSAAGFQWDFGEDDSGLMMKALRTASGYYIDVGACELIINGDIKVRSQVDIETITENTIQLSDGSEIPADVIVYATGYGSLEVMVEQLISTEVAEKIGPFWGYGAGIGGDPGPWEGELRNMWKPTKQDNLWFHGGNLHLSRHYSLYVSLQIKARMEGIPTPVYW